MSGSRGKVLSTLLLGVLANGAIFDRCELFDNLLDFGVRREEIGMWICLAMHSSRLNSDYIDKSKGDDEWFHGLWQISDKLWVGRNSPGRLCNMTARDVRGDYIGEALDCARLIYEKSKSRGENGWDNFRAYKKDGFCKRCLLPYVNNCEEISTFDQHVHTEWE